MMKAMILLIGNRNIQGTTHWIDSIRNFASIGIWSQQVIKFWLTFLKGFTELQSR